MIEKSNQSADRIFLIIEAIARAAGGIGITEISKAVQLPKSTVHRIVYSLVNKNYLALSEDKFTLGYRLIAIAGDHLSRLDIRKVASPFLHNLSSITSATAHIAIRQGNYAVYIDKIQPYTHICMYSDIGRSIELYCSGLGKALLLGLSEDDLKTYLKVVRFNKFTENTLDREKLIKELSIARKTGVTIDNAEHENGVFCLATPIYDYNNSVIAAISISSSNKSLLEDDISKDALLTCGKEISEQFGKI